MLDDERTVQVLLDLGVSPLGLDQNGHFPQFNQKEEFLDAVADSFIHNLDDEKEIMLFRLRFDSNCCVPLCVASMMDRESVVRVLLDRGVDPNLVDPNGDLTLGLASRISDGAIVRLLIEKGANIDGMDGNGKTALDWALTEGGIKPAVALIEAGADLNLSRAMKRI